MEPVSKNARNRGIAELLLEALVPGTTLEPMLMVVVSGTTQEPVPQFIDILTYTARVNRAA